MILAAVERRWRMTPDLRLGQFLANLVPRRELVGIEDGELLKLLGPETEDERRYIEGEPEAARRGWREDDRQMRERRDDKGD